MTHPNLQQAKLEGVYNDVGGIFKATVLIQKRLRELNRGAKRLVEEQDKNTIVTVIREVEAQRLDLLPDTDENREAVRAELEGFTGGAPRPTEVEATTTNEDELERRIFMALNKQPPAGR